jgi:hypothetical protein
MLPLEYSVKSQYSSAFCGSLSVVAPTTIDPGAQMLQYFICSRWSFYVVVAFEWALYRTISTLKSDSAETIESRVFKQ